MGYMKMNWQETRLFDVPKGITKSMRGKEDSADYRYFPDPDLRVVLLTDKMIEEAKKLPELPDQKIEKYVKDLKIKYQDAVVITAQKELAEFFEEMIKFGATPKSAVNWLTTELLGRINKLNIEIQNSPVDAKSLALLVKRVEDGTVSGKGAKDVLDFMVRERDLDVDKIIQKLGLKQVSDDKSILSLIDEVLSKNSSKVDEYKNGKTIQA